MIALTQGLDECAAKVAQCEPDDLLASVLVVLVAWGLMGLMVLVRQRLHRRDR